MVKTEDLQNRILLDERLRYVHTTVLPRRGIVCGHCFGAGRDAALYEIVHASPEPGVPRERGERLQAASVVGSRGRTHVHSSASFAEGRELALKALNDWKPEEHRPQPGHDLPKPGAPAPPGHELPGAKPPEATTKPADKPVHLPKPA